MTTASVRELFELPNQVGKGDFVVRLSEGVAKPEVTLHTYVATPALVSGAFRDSLGLVKKAIDQGVSNGAFLHGSFGSGKSHFMAILSLLIDNHPGAWGVADFHPLRGDFDFVAKKKILQLRFHMIGQRSLEGAIFGEYLRVVRERFPQAPLPALFADEGLFVDASGLLDRLGDQAFFEPMNESTPADDAWGEYAETWDRARFMAVRGSDDPKQRQALYSALAKSHFKYAAEQTDGFIDLDRGLKRIADHAKVLGFDALVLLLDELVLWLASRASQGDWLHIEAQKMVKLIEAQHGERAIPVVSFIARQRDLADMVGEAYAGHQEASLRTSLTWSKGRFQTIQLPDSELPEIVSRRVVIPKDDQAKKTLDEAFRTVEQTAGKNWNTLLGEQDAKAFRKLYPFSPVLVDTLVALSNTLQRERTALKLLMELLIEHIRDLKVGDIVGVGDLFDVLAGGDDTTDGPMRARFDAAKDLYRNQLLPMIQAKNQTGTAERCQRLRDGHKVSVGCSGCAEKLCRRDNRIAKTMLLAALVPEVRAFKNLTVNRLAALNHGTLGKMPVPGQENVLVAGIVRDWATQVGQIHVGEQADPSVLVELLGVNLEPIMARGKEHDTPTARRRVLRGQLFEALQLTKTLEEPVPHKLLWRGTERKGAVRFGNIRTLPKEQLLCAEGYDWYIVVDYPFDDPGFGPNNDIEEVTKVRDTANGTWTLAWIPSFFSEANNRLVGDLAILDHILQDSATTAAYLNHLTVEQQTRARTDLDNLRSQKRAKLRNLLEQAYGIVQPVLSEFDSSRMVDDHRLLLKPGIRLDPALPPNLGMALEHYVGSLLDRRFSRHPPFQGKISKQLVARMLEFFEALVDAPERKLPVDKDARQEVQALLEPLGLVRTTESMAFLCEDAVLQMLENTRNQGAVETPTVGQVRSWMDPKRAMGLPLEIADLVVRAYARWAARTLVRNGAPYEVQPGVALHSEVELEKPPLPTQTEWSKALDAAGHLFGITLAGKALHADNLKRFETQLKATLKDTQAVAALPALLAKRLAEYGNVSDAPRLVTAKSADTLCAALAGKNGLALVQALAGFVAQTSPQAVGKSIARAQETSAALEAGLTFGVFAQLKNREPGVDLLVQLASALSQDELNVELAQRLRSLAEAGQKLLLGDAMPVLAQGRESAAVAASAKTVGELSAKIAALPEQILAKLPEGATDIQVTIKIEFGR